MSAALEMPEHTAGEAAQPLIELVGISKTYSTGEVQVNALRGVSLRVFPGEFVALMGASGSGKSTLMNILGCLDRPTAGEYRFAGRDVARLTPDELAQLRREAFGFVFQGYNLIGTSTAVENVEIPATYAGVAPRNRRTRAETLLGTLGLGDRLDHRPNQLSGGQQQRVSIARALMNGGQVILADEPTGALDSRSGAEVMSLLQDLAERGHTVLLITHDREVAAHADRIIEIKDGSIIADSGGGQPKPRVPVARGGTAAVVDAPWAGSTSQNRTHSASPIAGGFEALRMAVRSLKANLLRTVLTLLGIVIGVGSVIAMLAIGEGAAQQVVDRIGRMGSNLLVVRAGTPSQRGPRSGATTLMLADVEELKRVDNVLAAVPESQGNVTVRSGSLDVRTQVTATSPDYPLTRDWPVASGVFFEDEDQRNYATVAVLGQTVVNNMFPDGEDPIGRYVLLDNVPFLVIGVMSSKGATQFGQDSDDAVFVPVTTGGLRLFGQRYLRSVTVAVKDLDLIDGTQEKVSDLLAGRHGQQDFQITNMVSLIETVSATQNTLTALLGSIAAISLLVGGIGVMNIMLVSVTERTREIGIRMATGARTRDVLRQFLTEATVVCAMGGMIGVLIGLATGYALTRFGMPVKFTASPMILAFCCAVATGVVFGFAPALKAARLDPVVALSSK